MRSFNYACARKSAYKRVRSIVSDGKIACVQAFLGLYVPSSMHASVRACRNAYVQAREPAKLRACKRA
jgi:hypothetical protein